ncbi:MAG: hypothetical protein JWP97_1667 [Labilithrix sp.]|nr:hypothetical protein [Labilithrix sp.]
MRKLRAHAIIVAIASAGLAAAAACSFPEVTFSSGAPDGSADARLDDATEGPEAGGDGSVPRKPDVDPDGGASDGSVAGDAAVPIDASGCVTCDCDHDGYDRVDKDAGCDGKGGTKGALADCDDHVAAIHPEVPDFLLDIWPASTHVPAGDWDCDGTALHQYDYNATCAALSACSGGFVGNPPCGATADYLTCQQPLPLLGLTCSEKARESAGKRTQGCK